MAKSFIESVENEKSWETLHSESPSARLRRMMFRGQTIWPKSAIDIGASKGLPGAIIANMEEWGFKFERVPGVDGHHEQGFKLINRDHVPTVRAKKPGGIRGARKRVKAEAETSTTRPGDLRVKIRAALEAGDALSDKECQRIFDCSAGNLRQVINTMEKEGFKFDDYKSPSGKMFVVKKSGKAMAHVGSSNGNGHAANDRLPVLFGGQQSDDLAVPPVPMFGGHVQVVGQHMSRDGVVSLVLRTEEYDWLTTVDGPPVEADA